MHSPHRRRAVWTVFFLLLAVSACKDKEKTKPQPYVLPPEPLNREAFQLAVHLSTTMAVTGQEVTLAAFVARGTPQGNLALEWDLGTGTAAGTAPGAMVQKVSFAQPGRHIVTVRATDAAGGRGASGAVVTVLAPGQTHLLGDVDGNGAVDAADAAALRDYLASRTGLSAKALERADADFDGRIDETDLTLVEHSAESGSGAPRLLWPNQGPVGRMIHLYHPLLLDPSVSVEVQFAGAAEPDVPVRTRAGVATFAVPPDLSPGPAALLLYESGVFADYLEFEVLPSAPPTGEPGARVLAALAQVETALADVAPIFEEYLRESGADEGQVAVITGILRVAQASFGPNRRAFEEAFALMEPEARTAFEQIALANGLEELTGELAQAQARLASLRQDPSGRNRKLGASVISMICAARKVADVSAAVAKVNEVASSYIARFNKWPVNLLPGVGQIISFLQSASSVIGALTDLIGMAAQFIPEFGDVEVLANPSTLSLGQSATLTPRVQLVIAGRLCAGAAESVIGGLVEQMQDAMARRLGRAIPYLGGLFAAAKFEKERMNFLVSLAYEAVSEVAGAALDALGVKDRLMSLAETICGALAEPSITLSADTLSGSCGNVAGGTFTCTEACAGPQTFQASPELCGETKNGEGSLVCDACTATTCALGCCSSGMCLPQANQTAQLCGTGGAACQPCNPEAGETCVAGVCTCVSDCTTSGEKSCLGTKIRECREMAGHPGCLRWQEGADCVAVNGPGARCEAGECAGGCNAGNCNGCCLENGTCLPGTADGACGAGGALCRICTGSIGCRNQTCAPFPCETSCDGCCRGDVCIGQAGVNDLACGTGGAACQTCDITQGSHCESGVCTDAQPGSCNQPYDCYQPGTYGCTQWECVNHTCVKQSDMPQGTSCTDDDECTTNDACDGRGHCTGTPRVCDTPLAPAHCYVTPGTCRYGNCEYEQKPTNPVACSPGSISVSSIPGRAYVFFDTSACSCTAATSTSGNEVMQFMFNSNGTVRGYAGLDWSIRRTEPAGLNTDSHDIPSIPLNTPVKIYMDTIIGVANIVVHVTLTSNSLQNISGQCCWW